MNNEETDNTKELNDEIIEDTEDIANEIQEAEAQIEDELEELNQQYLRLAADFENYKKRMTKERADSVAYGNEELIKEMLNVWIT